MPINYYIFVDKFVVPCDAATAFEYIINIEEYPRWWGKVYKKINKLNNISTGQPGAKYAVTVGGFLPYTLTIDNEVASVDKPYLIRFYAIGDLQGMGTWLFRETAEGTEVRFDWRVAANTKLIRWLSFLLKPLFRANHVFCVKKAKEGMTKDLQLKNQLAIS